MKKEKKQKENSKSLLQKIIDKAQSKKKQSKAKANNDVATPTPKPKAPFKIILCITFASNGNKIVDIFNSKEITSSVVVKGYGTAHTNMLSVLGITETERDVVIGLVKTECSENLISNMLVEFDNHNIKNTFCCLLSPSSANLELIKLITQTGV
ncbi:MAG: hypothetical protein IJZ29_05985 [Clostridia bacterium]|nr:hypothetical protein [Clostridia bacterium]